MRDILLVASGGALGACARFGASLVAPWSGSGLPWATLLVNLVGSALMGLLFAFSHDNRTLMLFLGAGVLGGFTTFSAFSLETVRLIERGEIGVAALYVALSVLLGVSVAFGAFIAARGLT